MLVMDSDGNIFDERRKTQRRKSTLDVPEDRRKDDRRKKDINANPRKK